VTDNLWRRIEEMPKWLQLIVLAICGCIVAVVLVAFSGFCRWMGWI
jgi:nitrate reductase NapE component